MVVVVLVVLVGCVCVGADAAAAVPSFLLHCTGGENSGADPSLAVELRFGCAGILPLQVSQPISGCWTRGCDEAFVVGNPCSHVHKELPRQLHPLYNGRCMLHSRGIHKQLVCQYSRFDSVMPHVEDPWSH